MRYTVHTHRTFHHRITKYLGVLVASALIATLGLPSAAQAQTPEAPKLTGEGDGKVLSWRQCGAIKATWGTVGVSGRALEVAGQTHWKVEYTEPGVLWPDAKAVDLEDRRYHRHRDYDDYDPGE